MGSGYSGHLTGHSMLLIVRSTCPAMLERSPMPRGRCRSGDLVTATRFQLRVRDGHPDPKSSGSDPVIMMIPSQDMPNDRIPFDDGLLCTRRIRMVASGEVVGHR